MFMGLTKGRKGLTKGRKGRISVNSSVLHLKFEKLVFVRTWNSNTSRKNMYENPFIKVC